MTEQKLDVDEIEQHLRELFGDPVEPTTEEMIPACLGVLLARHGGYAVITQADLDAINNSKLNVHTDGDAQTITLSLEKVKQ